MLRFVLCGFWFVTRRVRYKPAIAAARWGFDGGAAKSDCVEMAVREIVDLMLWDDKRGAFNLRWLPPTACHGLRDMCVLRRRCVVGVVNAAT